MNIQQIAKLSGVSISTVSRVFSRRPGVRDEVRDRVMEIARSHGYRPRFTSRERNVVVITPYNAVFPVQSCVDMLLMALAQTLPLNGFRMEILPVNNLERLDSIQFCGAAAIGCELADFPKWAERFPEPLFIIDRTPAGKVPPGIGFVRSDEAQGMKMALEYLFSRGCRRIGCIIHGTPERGNALIRRRAVADFMKNRVPDADDLIYYSGDGDEKYVELIGKLLKKGVDALFCPGGNAGIISLYALNLFGRSVPGDVSLIASEQTAFSMYTTPPLTTLSPDYPQLAQHVCDLLESWIGNSPTASPEGVPYRLIRRESCR